MSNLKLSIIIPIYNEEKTIIQTLKRIKETNNNKINYETIVINDGSKDGTLDLLKSHSDLYDHLINYNKSFIHLKNANKINYELTSYNSSVEKRNFENIKLIFKDKININNKNYISDKKVIFIIGMPRSGTSLIEQILSSNSDIYGAGELPFICNSAENLFFGWVRGLFK